MSKSQRLTAATELAVVRLVNECRDLGDDAWAWQGRLNEGVRRLAGARIALVGPNPMDPRQGVEMSTWRGDGDWPSAEARRRWERWTMDPRTEPNLAQNPGIRAFMALPSPFVTVARQQLVAGREWEESEYVQERLRPDGIDEAVVSVSPTPATASVYVICAHRPLRDRPFPLRAVRVIEALQRELGPHLGRGLLVAPQPNLHGLSPRLREVLGCLLDGDGEKQAAARVGISPRTLHDHVKALYRHFGVSSRPELLAYFLRRHRPGL